VCSSDLELVDVAKDLEITGVSGLRKQDLVFRIMQAKAEREGNYFAGGILEMAQVGDGFLDRKSVVEGKRVERRGGGGREKEEEEV